MIWQIRGQEIECDRTLLMAILNLTPDSFSDGGQFLDPEKALKRVEEFVKEGADILDIGGESTRPGAEPVSEEEELGRILPVLEKIAGKIPIPISIDTTKSRVARICLEKGASIINDVSGLKDSGSEMAAVVKAHNAGLVLMHRRGNPQTMQTLTDYEDVTSEVFGELCESFRIACESRVYSDQIVVDPGLGFAKTAEQNSELLRNLDRFLEFGRPVLVGPSRKSFIGKFTGRGPLDREYATAAVCAIAVMNGASILRIHVVGPMRDAVRVAEAIRRENYVGTF
jgi:dihydropteroate synthase